MKKNIRIIISLMLAVMLCFSMAVPASAATQTSINEIFNSTADSVYSGLYLTVNDKDANVNYVPSYGGIAGEWTMYGLGNAKYAMSEDYVNTYKASVEKAVKDGYRGVPGQLHDRKYTDYSRVILAYSALGLDPTDIAGYNMVDKLADYYLVNWQGLNGPIWALRALDSGKYEFTEDGIKAVQEKNTDKEEQKVVTTRELLVKRIVDAQLKNGGWSLAGEGAENTSDADPDMTAMAVGAIAPYMKSNPEVKAAVDKAVDCMSKLQLNDGTYSCYGTSNSESCSQVICALVRVGINPNTDSRFKKNGKSVIDGLLSFYDEKYAGFRHVNKASGGYEPVVNTMATEQAFYALADYMKNVPSKATLSSAKKTGSRSLKATWKKTTVGSGYQVVIATNSSFTKNKKTYSASSRSTVSKSVTGLTSGKTYYVKVRAYKTVNGNKLYGAYSTAKKVVL